MYPVEKNELRQDINEKELSFDFTGTAFVLKGEAGKKKDITADHTFEIEVFVDGNKIETAKLPTNFTTRRQEICWAYRLADKKHTVRVKVLNPSDGYQLNSYEYLVYGSMPAKR